MSFSDRLAYYIEELGCSAKDLAEASGVSAAAISRYRAGDRTPDPDGDKIGFIANGIAQLSGGRFDERDVYADLSMAISGLSVDYATFLANVSALLEALPASHNELARALSFDPSYISRILSGQRRPADMQTFVAGIAQFAARRCAPHAASEGIKALPEAGWHAIASEGVRASAIALWLVNHKAQQGNPVDNFLEKLDAFDLDDFIRAIHFDQINVPTVPVQLPTTKTYRGITEMMACEIDFLKAVVTARSAKDVIMFSDMPLEDMAADPEFPKKWMFGMAAMLKKGLRLNMIHSTGRPLAEMMLGLESWIPMYMTGQVSPYYFEQMHNDVFCHILKVAGTVAMQGEAIAGHQDEGRYVLTKNRDEVRYYRRRAERMLEKARPLMRIITRENAAELDAFKGEESEAGGRRRIIMSSLPIGSIPAEVLERMLEREGLPENERDAIRAYAREQKTRFDQIASAHELRLEVPLITRAEFDEHGVALELSGMFRDKPIPYAYEDYAEHLAALRESLAGRENAKLVVDDRSPFRNIQIMVCEGKFVFVSKGKGPVIHFVIEHPQMIAAFEQFTAPVND